ncbi:WecB/TagA/CpsF family glycosyltransferase [Aestuariibacter sp. GS-14]|uniref:WecB/TagA/CpsF family glycosyltransferase n=1 Tax=Aestuariibacter sp. GS-14 TaxID=2590670 RepID=UPI00112BCCB2|nr:WecB/TagA/CpsF family glycosyltransferase [Aestuariibacter sp. GS-14]TPV53845.1 WecB/TagA/CpsF family glycosyltransferase [Aestuariibacter sp. GS-14]
MSRDDQLITSLRKIANFDISDLDDKKSRAYTFVNPYSVKLLSESNIQINQFDKIYVDGILMVFILRLLFNIRVKRHSFDFTSLADVVIGYACNQDKPIAFIGSDFESNQLFCSKIRSQYKDINLGYSRDGYFGKEEYPALRNFIQENSIAIVILGMGTPKQDELAIYLKSQLSNIIIFTCGGFIHQHASTENEIYYPHIIDKLNLRFLYRIFDEPKLLKRYIYEYPRSIFWLFKLAFKDKNV